MKLVIQTYTLGLMENNSYLLFDSTSRDGVIVDPSFGSDALLESINAGNINLKEIWITHAHFDHMAGVTTLLQNYGRPLQIGLHQDDLPLWESGGGADHFAIRVDLCPPPDKMFFHQQTLTIGEHSIEVRHAPGHSPGHVMFYSANNSVLICGDVIFQGNIGRTDLPGGNPDSMIHSLKSQVLNLPANTRLLPGHGPETTVAEEIQNNPFITLLR